MKLIRIFCCFLLVIGSFCTGPSTPEMELARSLYQEAVFLDPGDDADRIIDLCRQAVELYPEFTEAHRQIIRLTEDKDLLRQEYEGLVQENPDSAAFHYLLGDVSEGDAKKTHYEKAIELDPGSPWGYLGLGELLEDRRSFEEAAKNYQRVLEIDPKSEIGLKGFARVHGLMGRREDEISAYGRMISELPDAADGYWGLMRAYRKAERDTEAQNVLRQIYERFKSDPDNGALALFQIADSLEDPKEKARLWHRFIQDYPAAFSVTAVHNLLLEHYSETDPEKAEALARKCLLKEESPPNDRTLKYYAYRTLFDLYRKAGEARKEEELVQELLESGYPNANAYTHVARHYAKEGRAELAIRFFRRALDFVDLDNVHGTLFRSIGKPHRESLEEISRLARADISYELGQVLNKELRHGEAIAVIRPVVGTWDLLGDRIHFELAAAYEATGQREEALKHYASSLIDYLHDPARKPLESCSPRCMVRLTV